MLFGDSFNLNGVALADENGDPINNCWNSKSQGASNSGIDIDTFDVSWGSNILQSGNTFAKVDLPTQTDSWNLVYIILSFRSRATSGGIISYLVKR